MLLKVSNFFRFPPAIASLLQMSWNEFSKHLCSPLHSVSSLTRKPLITKNFPFCMNSDTGLVSYKTHYSSKLTSDHSSVS